MWEIMLDTLFPRTGVPDKSVQQELLGMESFPVHWEGIGLRRRGIQHIDSLAAPCSYESSPLVQRTLHQLKYRSVASHAVPLGALLIHALPLVVCEQGTVLTPVPLHWMRRFSRGFNQSLLLAEELSHHTGLPVVECLLRRRNTGRQATRNREGRLHALHDAFCFHERFSVPSHVVLIDDVATTGSTLDACARALKNAGVKRVDALAVAIKE